MPEIRVTSPLTVCPQQILGYRADGRPIRAIAGASPDGDGGGDSGGQGGDGGGQQGGSQSGGGAGNGGQQGGTGNDGDGDKGGQQPTNLWDDPVKAKAEIERLRGENAKTRTTAKENAAKEARDQLLKQLGLTEDGKDAPDPETLAAQLASRDAEMASMRRERAAEKAARTHNGDVDALMDSRAFVISLNDLDPADDKFAGDVDALVKKAITDNPKFKAQAQAAGQSGGEFTGRAGEQGKTERPISLGAAIKKTLSTTS